MNSKKTQKNVQRPGEMACFVMQFWWFHDLDTKKIKHPGLRWRNDKKNEMFVTGSQPPFRSLLKIQYPLVQVMHQYPLNSVVVIGDRQGLNRDCPLRFLYHYPIKGNSTEQKERQRLKKLFRKWQGMNCINTVSYFIQRFPDSF